MTAIPNCGSASAGRGSPRPGSRPAILDRVGDARHGQGVTAVVEAPSLADDAPPAPRTVRATRRRWARVRGRWCWCSWTWPIRATSAPCSRAADAAAADAVVLAGACADPLSPKVVRAAAGALFRVRVVETQGALALLQAWRLPAVGLVVRDGQPLVGAALAGPAALVVGGEARGLPADLLAGLADRRSIPMPGRAESLNVAMAATIALFEAVRQREAAGSQGALPSWPEPTWQAPGWSGRVIGCEASGASEQPGGASASSPDGDGVRGRSPRGMSVKRAERASSPAARAPARPTVMGSGGAAPGGFL